MGAQVRETKRDESVFAALVYYVTCLYCAAGPRLYIII